MAWDTFGGPSACHITHQSVGAGYLGPVSWTVAERAAWLIRLFLQIADQWLWVGQWIFPFSFFHPVSTLFVGFGLAGSGARTWCMGCFYEVHWMSDTSRQGGMLTAWSGRLSPTRGLDTHTYWCHTLSLYIMVPSWRGKNCTFYCIVCEIYKSLVFNVFQLIKLLLKYLL